MATFDRSANRTEKRESWQDKLYHAVKGNEYNKVVRENEEHPAHARSQADIDSNKRAARRLFEDK